MIGNGMAGVRTLEELLKIAPDLYDITVFGAEPHPNYNRILLSPVLAGEQTLDEIILNDWSWYTDNHITLHAGWKVTRWTASSAWCTPPTPPARPPAPSTTACCMCHRLQPLHPADSGQGPEGRDRLPRHCRHQGHDRGRQYKHAVVIGGGLLGLEAANGLMKRGMQVTVVHVMPTLMERQLDDVAGKLLQKSLEERGLRFLMGGQTQARRPRTGGGPAAAWRAVQFKDGTEVPTDLVVMAVGIRPNTELAEAMRLHVNRGIVVTTPCRPPPTRASTRGRMRRAPRHCLRPGGAAVRAGQGGGQPPGAVRHRPLQGSLTSTKLKVTGIDLFCAGDFMGGEGTEEIVMSDPWRRLQEAGASRTTSWSAPACTATPWTAAGTSSCCAMAAPCSDIRDKLMFGESNIGDAGHEGHNKAAAMADTDEVCGCNGVTKGTICKAIKEKGLFTLDEVRKHTKASASCGSCTGLVEQLLMFTAGGDYSPRPSSRPCAAAPTTATRRCATPSATNKLLTIADVFKFMEWKTPNGCASCRPAVNYYLISTWPKEAKDDPQSRLHQRAQPRQHPEGRHLQRDPAHVGRRDHGRELRRIADVVDKYKIPTVKVTGGQRIDLLGVKKEDLVRASGRTSACPAATPTPRRCAR
jgi:nitrite reductase (NADH) large subunit